MDASGARICVARIDARRVRERETRIEHRDSDWITWEIPKPKSQVPNPNAALRTGVGDLEFGIWDLGFANG